MHLVVRFMNYVEFQKGNEMKREHLFKGKTIKEDKWIYGDLIHSWHKMNTKSTTMIYNTLGKTEVDPTTVCEYTGLTDKNKTKIFEGDIVELLHSKGKDIRTVVWCEKFMSYELAINGEVDMHDGWDFTDCCYNGVIVGNIIDNKELLE